MSDALFDKTLKVLGAALNYRTLNQNVISSNIANADTPEYKAKRVEFEGALQRAIDLDEKRKMNAESPEHFSTGMGGISKISPEVYDDPNGEVNEDGNTVNRDEEMSRLTENQIMYDATVNLINKKLAIMKYMLNEGSK